MRGVGKPVRSIPSGAYSSLCHWSGGAESISCAWPYLLMERTNKGFDLEAQSRSGRVVKLAESMDNKRHAGRKCPGCDHAHRHRKVHVQVSDASALHPTCHQDGLDEIRSDDRQYSAGGSRSGATRTPPRGDSQAVCEQPWKGGFPELPSIAASRNTCSRFLRAPRHSNGRVAGRVRRSNR